jgi:amino acid adenylation domain-containing protein
LWGIVKAGGAYVPIDPSYPQDRVALMLEDAEVAVVVAQQSGQANLPPHTAKMVWIDTEWPVIRQEPTNPPYTQVAPDNLAYMIYTSGSTGKPKGVQVPHHALLNFLEHMAQETGLEASDRLLAVTSLSFDIAGLELWGPLLVGGQVVLASREMKADGVQLISCLETEAITVMQATPATWQLLVAQGWAGQPWLRLLCGGEQVPLDFAHQLVDRSQCAWNLYGPTETTVYSTRCTLTHDDVGISIGHPIANTQVYLEDRWGHLVPIGVPGELSIGGAGVARGYWQRPDITAERFVPNPYSATPGSRLYKTGDLVRARAAGQLEWLARLDHQIKLRGYRIELGEIETTLRRHPSVQEVVGLCREDVPGEKQVVAYIVSAKGFSPDASLLRTYLKKLLPEYMLPSLFVFLETLPLTPNGKVDKQALPVPEMADRTQGMPYVAPRTVLEELLVEVWQEVLKVERIGIHDNFFELGGHSLLATRVIARLRNALELDIPLRTLFEYPVIASLSMELDAQLADIFPEWPKDESEDLHTNDS